MSEYEYKLSAPLRNLITFNGSDGKPLLVIDGEKRRIEVSEGVDVSEAARAVLVAIEVMLWRGFASRFRNEALEEAARACERRRDETGPQSAYAVLDVESYTSACGGCAYDIRALKDNRP